MERTNVSILFGSFTVALIELATFSSTADAGWLWKSNKCAPACATTEPEQCVPNAPSAPTPPAAPVAPMAPQAPAVFQTPQATSDVSGPSESVGIRGFGIRFPEANLQLPTIQLPSVVRYRRGSEAHFESARAPQIAGMAAVPSQIAPGGPAIPVAPAAPMAPNFSAPPMAPAAPAAPAAPMNCVPGQPGASLDHSSATELAAMRELLETRRMLDLYRQELADLKRSLDNAPATASDDSNIPPAPSARRISYQGKPATAAPARRSPAAKIVEAGYTEDADDDEEVELPRQSRQSSNRRVSAEQTEMAPRGNRPVKAAERPNVGHSYFVDETEMDQEGLGTWKSEELRPLTSGRFGVAANRRSAN